MSKYNTSLNSLFECLSQHERRYVELAVKTLQHENRTYGLILKKYGHTLEGTGEKVFLSYMDGEFLERILIRVDNRAKAIRILAEKHNKTDEQILRTFQSKDDSAVIQMMSNLLKEETNEPTTHVIFAKSKEKLLSQLNITEKLLSRALDNVENFKEKQIFVYYYGILRPSMTVSSIVQMYPDYDEKKVKEIIVKITKNLPKLLAQVPEEERNSLAIKPLTKRGIAYRKSVAKKKTEKELKESLTVDILKYKSFFDIFYVKDDDYESRKDKDEIIKYFLKINDGSLVRRVFGDDLCSNDNSVKLTEDEIKKLEETERNVRYYIDRILYLRKGNNKYNNKSKVRSSDRIYATTRLGFATHFYKLFRLKDYTYAKKEAKDYLIDVVIANNPKYQEFFGEFYKDGELQLKYGSKDDADKLVEYVSQINRVIVENQAILDLPISLLDYFTSTLKDEKNIKNRQEIIKQEILSSPGVASTIITKLYGSDLGKLNPLVDVSVNDIDTVLSFISSLAKKTKRNASAKKGTRSFKKYKLSANFFEFLKDDETDEELYQKKVEIAKAFLSNSESKYLDVLIKFYGSDFTSLIVPEDIKPNKDESFALSQLRSLIKKHISDKLDDDKTVDMGVSKTFDDFVTPYVPETNKELYVERCRYNILESSDTPGREIFKRIYGDDLKGSTNVSTIKVSKKAYVSYIGILRRIKIMDTESAYEVVDLKDDFLENFYDDLSNREEKLTLINSLIEEIHATQRDLIRKLYDNNLMLKRRMVLKSSEVKYLNTSLGNIKNRIRKANSSKQKPVISEKKYTSRVVKEHFFDYFENISEEKKQEIISTLSNSSSESVKFTKTIYGSDLLQKATRTNLVSKDVGKIYYVVSRVENILDESVKTRRHLVLPKNLIDQFYLETDTEEQKGTIKEIVLDYLVKHSSAIAEVAKSLYDENYDLKSDININGKEKKAVIALFNTINKRVVAFREGRDWKKTKLRKSKHSTPKEKKESTRKYTKLPDSVYSKFIDEDTPEEEKETLIKLFKEFLITCNFKGIEIIKRLYDEDGNLICKVKLSREDILSHNDAIRYFKNNYLKSNFKSKKGAKLPISIYSKFIFEDTPEDEKEILKELFKKFLKTSKSKGANIINNIYNEEGNLISEVELSSNDVQSIHYAIRDFQKDFIPSHTRISNGKIKIKNGFIDDFIGKNVDSLVSEIITVIVQEYFKTSTSNGALAFRKLYDENFEKREDVELSTKELANLAVAKNYVKNIIVPRKLQECKNFLSGLPHDVMDEPTEIESQEPIEVVSDTVEDKPTTEPTKEVNMMDMGKNSDLIYTNDLFELEFILRNVDEEELATEVKSEVDDSLLVKAYNEYKNSNTIMEVLNISEGTLLEFYLNNLDNLDDIKEAFNFILHNGSKDIIKRLFITPLFLRVVNDLGDIEREILFLKLLQVSNEDITDELISNITKVDIDTIASYSVMTKEDKVNSLNDFITLKRK